jgi:hypothetical protein
MADSDEDLRSLKLKRELAYLHWSEYRHKILSAAIIMLKEYTPNSVRRNDRVMSIAVKSEIEYYEKKQAWVANCIFTSKTEIRKLKKEKFARKVAKNEKSHDNVFDKRFKLLAIIK